MKHYFLAIAICFLAVVHSTAQESAFTKGSNVVNLGIGFGGNLYDGFYSESGFSRIPLVTLSYERCIIGNLFNDKSSIGVGGKVGYTSAKYSGAWKSTDIVLGARGAFHYQFVDKLDTYAGVMLGYNVNKWKQIGTSHGSSGSSGFTWSSFVGARYYFAGPLAAFAELGYGYTLLNAGLSLRF